MSERFVSSRYRGVPATAMSAWADKVGMYEDVINFSLGDPDLTTDVRIIDAAAADARAGHTHYTDPMGDPELREQIHRVYLEDHGYDIPGDRLIVTTSACHGMWLVLESILDDGDEVILLPPYFTPYPHQVRLARGVPVDVDTYESDGFQVRPEALEAAITERTRAIVLNTPSNPTGACLSRETALQIAKIAEEHDLIVIADEIYTAFSYAEPFEPFLTIPGMAERTLTLNSMSKDYTMTGWRIGWVIGPPEVITTMKDVNENNVFSTPSVSQRAAMHALRLRHEIVPPIRELYRARLMRAWERACATPNMSCIEPGGGIYLWVNITATGLTSAQVSDAILEEAHVVVLQGDGFGATGEGYIRLAMTVDEDRIDEAFERIGRMPLFGG